MQSSAKRTGAPRSSSSGWTTGFRLIDGTRWPLGRSKWANNATLAPASRRRWIVGRATRKRVSSVTLPPSIGTLKSTRTRAVLAGEGAQVVGGVVEGAEGHVGFPVSSPVAERWGGGAARLRRDGGALAPSSVRWKEPPPPLRGPPPHAVGRRRFRLTGNFAICSAVSLMRVAKPHSLSYQLRTRGQLAVDDLGLRQGGGGGGRDVVQVVRHQRIGRGEQDAVHRAVGGGLKRRVDLLDRDLATGDDP